MSIPITFLLIIYLVFILFWLVFSFFNIFHAAKFGLATAVNKIALTTYIIVSAALLIGSLVYISTVDWSQTIELASFI